MLAYAPLDTSSDSRHNLQTRQQGRHRHQADDAEQHHTQRSFLHANEQVHQLLSNEGNSCYIA